MRISHILHVKITRLVICDERSAWVQIWQPIVQLSFPFILFNMIKYTFESCSNMAIIIRVNGISMRLKLLFSSCHEPCQLPFFDGLLLMYSRYLRARNVLVGGRIFISSFSPILFSLMPAALFCFMPILVILPNQCVLRRNESGISDTGATQRPTRSSKQVFEQRSTLSLDDCYDNCDLPQLIPCRHIRLRLCTQLQLQTRLHLCSRRCFHNIDKIALMQARLHRPNE